MTAIEPAPSDCRRRRGSVARLLGGVLLLLLVVAAASSRDDALWTSPDTTTSGPVEQQGPVDAVVPPTQPTDESGRWLVAVGPVVTLLAVLLVASVLVIAAVTIRRGPVGWSWVPGFLGRERLRPSFSTPRPEIPRVLEADGIAVLAALREGPPRNAIVRCWQLLERDAAAAGMRRAPTETSSEYVERVIGASSVDPQPITDLAALFREARFSSRSVDETRREQAEEALRRTLTSLGGRTEQRS